MKEIQGKISKEIKLNSGKLGCIFYSDKETELEAVVSGFKNGYLKASQFFRTQNFSINVVLVYSKKEMNKAVRKKTRNWFIGYANSYNTITILSPSVFEKESSHKKTSLEKPFSMKSLICLSEKSTLLTNHDGLKKGWPILLPVKVVNKYLIKNLY